MQINWKGQSYQSLEIFRIHLIHFEPSIVQQFNNNPNDVSIHVNDALSLHKINDTKIQNPPKFCIPETIIPKNTVDDKIIEKYTKTSKNKIRKSKRKKSKR